MLLLLLPLLGLPLLGLPLILLLLVLLLVVQGWTPQQGVVGLKPMSSKGGTPTASAPQDFTVKPRLSPSPRVPSHGLIFWYRLWFGN